MKKILSIFALLPLCSFAQINIEIESHTFVRNEIVRSSCFYGVSAYEQGEATLVLNLRHIVKVEIVSGRNKQAYSIAQDGIYDISLQLPNDDFIVVFTDWQGVKLWWYRY